MKARFFTVFLAIALLIQNVGGQVLINVGAVANDGTGDALRLAMGKANTNFTTIFGNATTVSNNVLAVAANLTTVSNNVTSVSANVSAVAANLTTVSNSVNSNAANLTTVSNSVGVVAGNLTTVSNSVNTVAANLTTVSNRLTTDIANLTVVSNNVTSVSANVSAVAANLTTVSNSLTADILNLTTVSNSVNTVAANLTTVSNSVNSVAANLTTVSNNVTSVSANVSAVAANLTTVSNSVNSNAANLTTVSNSVNSNAANLTTVSNSVNSNTANLTTVSNNLTTTAAYAAPLNPSISAAGGILQHNGTGWVTLPKGQNTLILMAGLVTNSWQGIPDYYRLKFSQTADGTVGNSTNESTIIGSGTGSKTIQASVLNNVGRNVCITVLGKVSNFSGLPVLTIRLRLNGGAALTGTLAMSNATDNDFEVKILMTVRSTGTGGTIFPAGSLTHSSSTGAAMRLSLVASGAAVVDLTAALTVDVTAQWSVAHASNTLTSQVTTIETLFQ